MRYDADIALACPDISVTTIERTLAELLTSGQIVIVSRGRSTAYARDDNGGE